MLTKEQIDFNSKEFANLIRSIDIEYANTEELLKFIYKNGFFRSPASTQFHGSYEGGLCKHSLDVYHKLVEILPKGMYSDSTVILVALLHDVAKCQYFESYVKNEKVYADSGSKQDEMGRFDWVSKRAYKVKDSSERQSIGDLAQSSFFIINKFIPLTDEEISAILNQTCGMENGYAQKDICVTLSNNNLAMYLHCADLICTYDRQYE